MTAKFFFDKARKEKLSILPKSTPSNNDYVNPIHKFFVGMDSIVYTVFGKPINISICFCNKPIKLVPI